MCPEKYRRVVFDVSVERALRDVCMGIALRFENIFLEIGVDEDHAHFLVQSVPSYSPTRIVRTIKSITAREIFKRVFAVKEKLWGGEFWSKGYFIATVGQHGSENIIQNYVKQQGQTYQQLHLQQLSLFVLPE